MAMVIKARGGPNNRPGNRKEVKMGRRFGGNEELCPECGHLLTTKSWNCQFCGWNMDNSKMHTSAVDLWNDYPDIDNISLRRAASPMVSAYCSRANSWRNRNVSG